MNETGSVGEEWFIVNAVQGMTYYLWSENKEGSDGVPVLYNRSVFGVC